MIRKLRLQFIVIATIAVTTILISIIGLLNSIRYVQVNDRVNSILTVLSSNDGEFPSDLSSTDELSESTASQYSYFSAIANTENDITSIRTGSISYLNESEKEELVEEILANKNLRGRVNENSAIYAYQIQNRKNSEEQLIVVLDATGIYDDRDNLLKLSAILFAGSLVFFIVIVSIFSGRAIKPFVENQEKQKQFITNVGHELKTPLAIISANTELEEMLTGETEWSKSTKDQTARMTQLINRMVTLARMEEQPNLVLEDLDCSAIVQDAAEDFKGPVTKDGKNFIMDITPGLHVKADEKSLFELVTILVDNANKYCDPNGTVAVKLSTATSPLRKVKLEVSNTYAAGAKVNYQQFFNRFYREDNSRNSKQSGFGIGLSMAQTIVSQFKAKIQVHYHKDTINFIVLF